MPPQGWNADLFEPLKAAGGKAYSNYAVGYNNVDVPSATERGIAVGNTPGAQPPGMRAWRIHHSVCVKQATSRNALHNGSPQRKHCSAAICLRCRGVEHLLKTPLLAGVLTETTAELALALTFAAARRVVEGDKFMRAGQYKGWLPDLFVGETQLLLRADVLAALLCHPPWCSMSAQLRLQRCDDISISNMLPKAHFGLLTIWRR